MKKLLAIFFLFIVLSSCNQVKKEDTFSTSNEAFENVLERFPSLVYSHRDSVQFISKRKISIENDSVQINLIKIEGDKDENQILIFKNKFNEYYAIPVFTTMHRDYWNFENDTILNKFPKVGTTFEKEYNSIFSKLKLKKNFYTFHNLCFNEILKFEYISDCSHLNKYRKYKYSNSYGLINNENWTYCSKRINTNIDNVLKLWKKYDTDLYFGDGMFIMFDNIFESNRSNKPIKIKCFRQDCNLLYTKL